MTGRNTDILGPNQDIDAQAAFEQVLRELLAHLYDPSYRPPETIWAVLGLAREQGVAALRDAILAGIEALKPSESVPQTARAWRIYGMLRYRFVENLPQESAAEHLGITARHLRRDIGDAVHALALHLWEKHENPARVTPESSSIEMAQPREREIDAQWEAQLHQELEALEETASAAGANVAEAFEAVCRLGAYLTESRGIALSCHAAQPGLMAAIHPSAMRQILISVVDGLARHMQRGTIDVRAEQAEGQVMISVRSAPVLNLQPGEFDHLREFLSARDGAVETTLQGEEVTFQLTLPAVDRCVLVVDDNADIVHLYRRYVTGTRYYIQHVSLGSQVFDMVDAVHPDVVILDVMLPDIDGWDLLTRLHENPATRALPVVVCTVMHEKELALALGARQFLTKPVQRGAFLNALEQAAAQAAAPV